MNVKAKRQSERNAAASGPSESRLRPFVWMPKRIKWPRISWHGAQVALGADFLFNLALCSKVLLLLCNFVSCPPPPPPEFLDHQNLTDQNKSTCTAREILQVISGRGIRNTMPGEIFNSRRCWQAKVQVPSW